jgi:hypothetical protein
MHFKIVRAKPVEVIGIGDRAMPTPDVVDNN